MRIHVVSQGEHLLEIATHYGTDVDTIWGLDQNEPLKKGGRTPEILAPGDVVFVPDVAPNNVALATGQTNTFTAPADPTVDAAVKLIGADGSALANEPYEVEALGLSGQTGADGTIQFKALALDVKSIVVQLTQRNATLCVRVGHLDPVATPNGKAQRLAHLGYFLMSGDVRVSSEDIADALATFAAERAPDAQSDADVEQALVAAHGL